MSRQAAEAALAAGDLAGSRAHLVEAVRSRPGDPALRSFLFQLSCVLGDWTRADKQLEMLGQLQPEALDMITDYRAAIAAEATRAAVMAGTIPPDIFGDPKPWAQDLAEALRAEAKGETAAATNLRSRALDAAPAVPGTLDGTGFSWLADADTRFGPLLEVVMNGAYRWIALSDLTALELTAPSDLRDVVWSVGIATFAEGAQWPVLIPARYPGTEATGDPALMLGRRTEWRALGAEGHAAGLGQRLLAHEAGDVALLDVRALTLTPPAGEAG